MARKIRINKRTAASIFIAAIMVFSMVGYAALQAVRSYSPPQAQNPLDEVYSVNRTLTAPEKVYIMRTGRMLIENIYDSTGGEIPELVGFAAKHPTYVFVEQGAINETANETAQLKLIGRGGDIKDLDPSNITEEHLFDLLCEFGLRRPVECTLREM
jgi:hypothetical protein